MNLTPESRVGEIATRYPLATRVFARHGIDFCCCGGVAIADACVKRQLDTADVLAEIEETIAAPGAEESRWDERPLVDIVHHIVEHFHVPLREELPRLESMARKVLRVHGERDPRLAAVLGSFLNLKGELDEHMHLEEERLFPAILAHASAATPFPAAPIAKFVDDHSRVGIELGRIRELTDDFHAPEGACNTWNALWHGLAALETDLHQHIHLENNILFPRVSA